jgi:8-oxo-dGTP pyrophosphatase MutT (NUDIX family)
MAEKKYDVRERIMAYRGRHSRAETEPADSTAFNTKQVKESRGIALVGIVDGKMSVLMTSKRFSYAFNEFVHGKYTMDRESLIRMFDQMYLEDKITILSLDFTQIWYRVWLNLRKTPVFYIAKSKFESNFLVDGGVFLRKLIQRSKNAPKIWEIPKGRKKNKNEASIHCAIREFAEETNITPKSYKLFPSAKRTYSYVDKGVTYINTYYIGYTRSPQEPVVSFKNKEQVDEIGDIKWMSIEDIRIVDSNKQLEKFIKPIFRYVRNRLRE